MLFGGREDFEETSEQVFCHLHRVHLLIFENDTIFYFRNKSDLLKVTILILVGTISEVICTFASCFFSCLKRMNEKKVFFMIMISTIYSDICFSLILTIWKSSSPVITSSRWNAVLSNKSSIFKFGSTTKNFLRNFLNITNIPISIE